MQSGTVPKIWNQAIVVPIFKKGVSSNPKNYRPISLTCVGSKIFESGIKRLLVPFLEGKKLLSINQHGFRAKHSTCINLLECLNEWTANLDAKTNTFVAHIDFSRAFDTVPLPKLMHKLKNAGVADNLFSCIHSMLFGRSQRVKVGNSFSVPLIVKSGVPQGSVLGPILFIFYINDLTEAVVPPSTPKLYADDLKAFCSDKNDKGGKTFNDTLTNIAAWASNWQLVISNEKSKWLLISNYRNDPEQIKYEFNLGGEIFPRVTDVLDLGVNFTSRLSFSNHITIMITKAKQRLFLLNKCFLSRNPKLLILAFKTYVIPLLEYCSPVWNPQNIQDIKRIESVQRMFTKRLIGFESLNYPARLERARLCTLELRRLRADLSLCYNILHGLVETPISNFFAVHTNNPTRGHSWKLKSTVPRLDCRQHFFSHRIINVWNALSQKTVDSSSTAMFRARLKTESLEEFLYIKE